MWTWVVSAGPGSDSPRHISLTSSDGLALEHVWKVGCFLQYFCWSAVYSLGDKLMFPETECDENGHILSTVSTIKKVQLPS